MYHNSARFGDYVIVTSKIKKIGTTSLTFTHNLVKEKDNQLLAEVECVRIAISLKEKSLTDVEEFFQKYS